MLTITIFPFTVGSHLTKARESWTLGNKITGAVIPFLPVLGLQASCVALRLAILGDIISTCDISRSQPRHVPHCWFSAEMPHLANLFTAQSWAVFICGVPTNLGPLRSKTS